LQETDWETVYQENDAEAAYNSFINIVTEAYRPALDLQNSHEKGAKTRNG